ncbi:MAG: hypothetical protein AB1486_14925 [Planctomycetota bacterium]
MSGPPTPPRTFQEALRERLRSLRGRVPRPVTVYRTAEDYVRDALRHNWKAVWAQISQSREVLVLLFRYSRGERLTPAEIRKVKVQLLDLARAIPALGIFALPGGALLLSLMAKAMPWALVPSAFLKKHEKDDGGEDRECRPMKDEAQPS